MSKGDHCSMPGLYLQTLWHSKGTKAKPKKCLARDQLRNMV